MSPTEWKKMFANHISGKGIVPRVCEGILQLIIRQSNLKMAKGSE